MATATAIVRSAAPKPTSRQHNRKVKTPATVAALPGGRPTEAESPSLRAGGSATIMNTALARAAAPATMSDASTALGDAMDATAATRAARERMSAIVP